MTDGQAPQARDRAAAALRRLGHALVLRRRPQLRPAAQPDPAFTGRLVVHYRAPTPLGRDLVCRAREVTRDGRKITMTGELHDGEVLVAEAEGLFVVISRERLGLR